MSEQETITGKLKLIPKLPNETLEDQCKRVFCERFRQVDKPFWDSWQEDLEEVGYRKFVIHQDDIYEVIQMKDLDDLDIFNMSKNNDGTFDFTLSYYNGGCCFSEAIGYAFENMEENNGNQ